jgi:hypothetical protein
MKRFTTWLNTGDNAFWIVWFITWTIVVAGTIYSFT